MTQTPLPQAKAGQDISHRGSFFRMPGRGSWHTEAHREYGVVWSLCGMRTVVSQAETRGELAPGDAPCTRCAGRKP